MNLRCETLSDPSAINRRHPILGWQLTADTRDVQQSAYQVLVASSAEKLAQDEGDLWDSGRIVSAEASTRLDSQVELLSGEECYWKVRVWDQRGRASAWSDIGRWAMGLLDEEDWQAEWVEFRQGRQRMLEAAPFAGTQWIGPSQYDPANVPTGRTLYVSKVTLPTDVGVKQARLYAVADDQLHVAVNGGNVVHGVDKGWQVVKPVDIASHLLPGDNEIRAVVTNASQGPSGLLLKAIVETTAGETITLQSDESWQVVSKPGGAWHERELSDKELMPSRVLGEYGCKPWGETKVKELFLPPPAVVRQSFRVTKPVARATAYVTALGLSDLHLNGQRVADEYFTPGWTDYEKRVYYRAYDVTERLVQGKNAIGAVLADGWYAGYIGWGQIRDHYGEDPLLRIQLQVEYDDGTQEVIGTDANWKASFGPTQEADFLMGESYDARSAGDDWCSADFDDSGWDSVSVVQAPETLLQAHPGPPVRAVHEFRPVKIAEPQPSIHVFDLGQNFAGVVRLKVRGRAGQKVTLRFAERLNPDGTVYVRNLRGARTIDTYICRDDGVEVWQPRYVFHGFQYVEVTGLEHPPEQDTIVGVALSSDTPRAGSFECSNAMLNQLYSNIYWTQAANFIEIPTDCPQRDERLGWTGDAQVYVETACLNADVQAFFRKWLVDLVDAQRKDGQFPMVAPLKVAGDDGGPAWADAGVIVPWTIYKMYGDLDLLRRQYDSMKAFVEFSRRRCDEQLLPPERFHCFGDWLSINADTPKDVLFTAFFAYSTKLVANSAEALGELEDAEHYDQLFQQIKSAFGRAYVEADGKIKGDTQCAYALAIVFDLLSEEQLPRAAEHLVRTIEEREGRLSTGFVGTRYLMQALTKTGRSDVAYRLLLSDEFPSWGFSIKHGATSIWERWDGWTPEKGFQNPGMNSFAHYSFGAVYLWMFENIGGIRCEAPGFKRFTIDPQMDGPLTWARTSYDSVAGTISTNWSKDERGYRLQVVIPANTIATVCLPKTDSSAILEGGNKLEDVDGIRSVVGKSDRVQVEVASGEYAFFVPKD